MPDWLFAWLAQLQGDILRTLAADLRAGGPAGIGLAAALGALHALTPGHGKSALATYFLGREASVWTGMRIALTAALLHVLSGLAAFVVLRLLLGQVPLVTARGAPGFAVMGYAFVLIAGVMMLVQALRPQRDHDGTGHTLAAGIGLLPCPLTVTVLGFAWLQGNAVMVAIIVVSLALGIAATIGVVAVLSIIFRHQIALLLKSRLQEIERWSRIVQGLAGAGLVAIAIAALLSP